MEEIGVFYPDPLAPESFQPLIKGSYVDSLLQSIFYGNLPEELFASCGFASIFEPNAGKKRDQQRVKTVLRLN